MKSMGEKLKVGVLASGSGTDLQSIIDASEKKMIDAEVVVVISDNKDAFALKRAEKHKIPAFFVNPKGLSKEDHDKEIDKLLVKHKVGLIVGAGYMRIISACFVKKWYGRLINIHPALLPAFKGLHAHRDVLEYGVKVSGCTVHFVDVESDHGPIIIQKCVPVYDTDTEATLGSRVLEWEHKIFPKAIELFCDKKLNVAGRLVVIDGDVNL